MFLPALTVALGLVPILVRSLRASLLEVFESDYITTARSKGLPERRVLIRHGLRNAIISTISVLAVSIGFLVGGTLIIEQVYALPGIGQLMINSILQRDFPVVQAVTLVFAIMVVLVYLLADILHAALDPRVQVRLMASAAELILDADVVEHRRGFRHRWYRTPSFVAGLSIIVLITMLGVFAPLVTWHDPVQQDLLANLQGPSLSHPLGTDELGRDVLTRMIYAVRTDLRIAVLAVLIPFVLGTAIGLVSGYFGRSVDSISSWAVNVVVAFPFYVLIIALVFALGNGTRNIYIAIALVGWVSYTRIVRGEVLVVKRREYVLAARTAGLSNFRIIRRHVLPNVITQAIVFAMSDIVLDHPRHRHARLSGPRCAAADAGLGPHDRRRAALPDHELGARHVPRPRGHPDGPRAGAHRRRPRRSPATGMTDDHPPRPRPARGVPARTRPRARRRRRLLRAPPRRGARARRRVRLREDDGAAGARRPASTPGSPRRRGDPLRGRRPRSGLGGGTAPSDAVERSRWSSRSR